MIAIMLSAIMVLGVLGNGIVPGVSAKAAATNIALNRPVEVSNQASDYRSENAVDGDIETAWRIVTSNADLEHWVIVDLGKDANFESVEMNLWKTNDGTTKWTDLEYSNDKDTWTSIFESEITLSPTKGNFQSFSLDSPINARYVRVTITRNTEAPYRIGLREIRVFGSIGSEDDEDDNISLTDLFVTSDNGTHALTPAFSSNITEYSVELPTDIDEVSITPVGVVSGSSITVDGNVLIGSSITVDVTTTTTTSIKVEAENGDEKTYTITFAKSDGSTLSSNANLASLTINPGIIDFNSNTVSYIIEVPENTTKIEIIPMGSSEDLQTIEIDEIPVSSGESRIVTLAESSTEVKITVIAEDEVTSKIYTLIVNKVNPDMVKIPASEDTYVETNKNNNRDTNYSNQTQLRIKGDYQNENSIDRIAYIKFELGNIEYVENAILNLHIVSRDTGAILDIGGFVDNGFHANQMTWNAQPVVSNLVHISRLIEADLIAGQVVSVDVSDYLNTQLLEDKNSVWFKLYDIDAGPSRKTNKNVIVASIESGSNAPYLSIIEGVLPAVDVTELSEKIVEAQNLYDNAVEGTGEGQYPIGAKALLQTAIDDAKEVLATAVAENSKVKQSEINAAVEVLEIVIIEFKGKVLGNKSDINGNGKSDAGDLAYVASRYGSNDLTADINGDGKVDDTDINYIVNSMKKESSVGEDE